MKNKPWRKVAGTLMGLTLALASSCVDQTETDDGSGEGLAGAGPGGGGSVDWKPGDGTGKCNIDALLTPRSYGSKIKTLLAGTGLNDAEYATLSEDPGALRELIDSWLETGESDAILRRFFMSALQQTGGNNESLFYMLDENASTTGRYKNPASPRADEMLNQNFSESMARTAVELTKQGKPFSEIVTTDTFMLTTAMMSFLAFHDDEVIDDEGGHTVRTTAGHFDTITLVRDATDAPPPEEALDPNSPNFATFWHPRLGTQLDPAVCNVQQSQTIDTTQFVKDEWRIRGNRTPSFFVFSAVALGRMQSVGRHQNALCNTNGSSQSTPLLKREHFEDWRMITVRKPSATEQPSYFYRTDKLESATHLVLHTPRTGFLTSLGFLSTWLTNEDNSSRVTVNQSLIVAVGSTFDGVVVPGFDPGDKVDEVHAEKGSECYGCHQTLDPMRDYFRASFTNFYSQQLDAERSNLPGDFVFGGVKQSGNGVTDLAQSLATHSLLPYAWADKLCYYANAQPCEKGAELDRVVDVFVDSNLDFRVLLRELLSSPLVTGSACVPGVVEQAPATIARRSTFCHQLSNRLGVDDICGLSTLPAVANNLQNTMRNAVASVPDDGFSRDNVAPVVIAETGLFTRANREAACNIAADKAYTLVFGQSSATDVLDALVVDLVGLPAADPRHDAVRAVLKDHLDEALASGKPPQQALQSTMALACMAPSSAGVGF